MHPSAAFELPAPRQRTLGLGVVVLLHVLFLWALNAGLGRKLLQSAPMVVVAQLVSESSPPPLPEAPPTPPPKATAPPPTRVVLPVAPVLEPTPVTTAPAPAIVLPATPPASMPATPVVATPTLHVPEAPVRVPATLQASGTCRKPEYPALSRRREEQGVVLLKFLIGSDGGVLESQIGQSSGYTRLDEAARAGLSKCQFKPGTVDGKPEPSWASIRYNWQLD